MLYLTNHFNSNSSFHEINFLTHPLWYHCVQSWNLADFKNGRHFYKDGLTLSWEVWSGTICLDSLSCSPQYCTCLVPTDKLSRKMPNRKQILKCSVELSDYWFGFRYLALRYLWLWGYWIFDISPHFCNFICNWPAKPIISNQGMF